jgi:hypothetical protein
MKDEPHALLWSHSQKCFHVETPAETQEIGQRSYIAGRPMDYIVLHIAESAEKAMAFRECFTAKHGRPE